MFSFFLSTQREESGLKKKKEDSNEMHWKAIQSQIKNKKKNQKNAEVKFVFAKRPASTAKHLSL